ncbi:CCA tRNA nucleotidyltransferase (plasmid) [Pontibacillus sp. ALD_SL1]|uniref:CCA tRNA nucleotidyltransferase n=1 Tax=Pontibacillus sp. ALD_SL1 TaxID=2777185 RepID=UPI001A96B02D|nr:CCA tRNA nucleotidyltransferase [Pontibacillus sp. ALD_SL1]QST03094.1 CCA tRNA nucleotidyltransferase [Pontibacillus sp. ALD_SL1]
MNMIIEPRYLHILNKLQTAGPSFIVGGYLRDKLAGLKPNDVDFATCASMEAIKTLFPSFHGTEEGLRFGVGRIRHNNETYEISFYDNLSAFESSMFTRDLTLNSLYHDGEHLYDPCQGAEDIKENTLRAHPLSFELYPEKPQQFLRVIRLQGVLGFSLDPSLQEFLQEHTHLFYLNTTNRMVSEGYNILLSSYPLASLQSLSSFSLIPSLPPTPEFFPIRPKAMKMEITLGVLASMLGEEAVLSFLRLFQLSNKYEEKLFSYLPYLNEKSIPEKSHLINEMMLIHKTLYQNEPDRFKKYLRAYKKS